jgi:cysteine desulfurase
MMGGAQQQGLRPGTVPVFLCVGLGEACRILEQEFEHDYRHSLSLRNNFLRALQEHFPDIGVNGDLTHRLPGNLNVRFPGLDAESLLTALRGQVAASTGSACNAGVIEPSYVLLALGLSLEEANSSIRFGFGRFTNEADLQEVVYFLVDKAKAMA